MKSWEAASQCKGPPKSKKNIKEEEWEDRESKEQPVFTSSNQRFSKLFLWSSLFSKLPPGSGLKRFTITANASQISPRCVCYTEKYECFHPLQQKVRWHWSVLMEAWPRSSSFFFFCTGNSPQRWCSTDVMLPHSLWLPEIKKIQPLSDLTIKMRCGIKFSRNICGLYLTDVGGCTLRTGFIPAPLEKSFPDRKLSPAYDTRRRLALISRWILSVTTATAKSSRKHWDVVAYKPKVSIKPLKSWINHNEVSAL